MKGVIEEIWKNETDDGKPYFVLRIGGDKYSVWDKKYMEGLEEGSTVEYESAQSGKFKKITDLKKIDLEPGIDPPERKTRNRNVFRSPTGLHPPRHLRLPKDEICDIVDIKYIIWRVLQMVCQVLIRVDKELKDKFQRISRTEQKSVNKKVQELMEEYVKEHDMEAAMRSLWDEIGQSLRKEGFKASDVSKRIKEVRRGR